MNVKRDILVYFCLTVPDWNGYGYQLLRAPTSYQRTNILSASQSAQSVRLLLNSIFIGVGNYPDAMFPVYLIVVVVVGAFLCLLFSMFGLVRLFISGRHRAVKTLSNLKYLPEIIVIKEEYVHVRKKLTKRQLRRKRMREVAQELKLTEAEKARWEELEQHIEDEEEEPEKLPPSTSRKVLSWVVGAFSSKSGKIVPTDYDVESGQGQGFSTKSNVSISSNDDDFEGSSKSKRFISQDRIARKEARMKLIRAKEAVQEEEEEEKEEVIFDNTVSLLSLAAAKKKRVEEIMEARKLRKDPGNNTVDVISLNAGPSSNLVPAGYELLSQELGPELINPDVLIYKRILFLWDGSVGGIIGWHIGTIVGISETPGYNFRIKYDRAETKSIFVDGIQPVFLSLSGENAFGRRWVVMKKKATAGKL